LLVVNLYHFLQFFYPIFDSFPAAAGFAATGLWILLTR
jgi:hypothetical protein